MICSRCGKEHFRSKQRYCKDCHATYMRDWRKLHPLTPDQKVKDAARSYAGVYKRRGKLTPQTCEECDAPAEMHHDDYGKPLKVRWLCRTHHLDLHYPQRVP